MLKKFTFNDDCLEIYDFVSIALQSNEKLEVFFKNCIITFIGQNIFIKYYADKEAIVGGKILSVEIKYA